METLLNVGCDTETHLIAHMNLAPRLVCAQYAVEEPDSLDWRTDIAARSSPDKLEEMCRGFFAPGVRSIWHNAAFDLCVIVAAYPHLMSDVFQALEEGRVSCTRIREKFLVLCTTGNLDVYVPPDDDTDENFDNDDDSPPEGVRIQYGLADLVFRYFNRDISASKTSSDAWRTNFDALESVPVESWPADAVDYALGDSIEALNVWHAQENVAKRLREERGIRAFATEAHRVGVDFALRLSSCRGIATDPVWFEKISKLVKEELDPRKHELLVDTGILRPGSPSRPYKKNPAKQTVAKKESINKKVLHAHIEKLATQFPEIKIRRTPKSEKFPDGQVSAKKEFLDDIARFCDVIGQYQHRQSLQKLHTTELPRLCFRDEAGEPTELANVVHPLYDCLKRTGRVSSMGDKKIPSFNVQNVSGKSIPVRGILVPRPGYLMYSVDYSYMELCTWAQKCIDLFGKSRLADIINAGMDPHSWLGSQLLLRLDHEFAANILAPSGIDATDSDGVYKAFMALKKCGVPSWEAAYKKWRTFAKPTGLGYPGGLGPRTFVAYAKATFGVIVNLEEATSLRDVWRDAIPEAAPYFEWINHSCEDPWARAKVIEDEDGNKRTVRQYAYTSPFGMYRAAADYCATANGAGLQTPSAEGATTAWFNHMRATYDPSLNSPIYQKTFPLGFIHDEILGEDLDDGNSHDRLQVVSDIMVESFKIVCPDVKMTAQPVLMRRWDKAAEPVFDANGRLIPWEPPQK